MSDKSFIYPEMGPHAVRPWNVRKGYADESYISDFRYNFPREDRELTEVFVYTDRMSYDPGETVELRGSTTADRWNLHIYRDGYTPEMVHEARDLSGSFTATSETAYIDGCDWPVVHRWEIPQSLRPGFYRIVATCQRKDGNRFVHHHFVVVRARKGESRAKIVMMLCTATWQAYNDWGGANHYFGTWGPNKNEGSPLLSQKRPWSRGMLWLPQGAARVMQDAMPDMGDHPRYPTREFSYTYGWSQYYSSAGWAMYDRHFAIWAEEMGYDFDIITQTDLHQRPDLLEDYTCLVTVGHDEYWSWEMRKAVEDWTERGGHFARFGGNFLWQIRLEDEGARQVCYKVKAPKLDPLAQAPATQHLSTATWESELVNWPGASTVGVNGCHGVYASWGGFAPRGSRGLTVYRPEHWAFKGTHLRYADIFGAEARIFGYEVDGLDYTFHRGLPYAVPAPGIPDNIEILAMSPAVLREDEHEGPGHRYYIRDGDLSQVAELAGGDYDEAYRKMTLGSGMLVSMAKGRGEVLTAGTCEWVIGLTRHCAFTQKITRNVLDRFSGK
ncbi:N,N-dimethylformamidase beta subunit family domain-containing protein [Falsigemmobacter faecalis]|uniref:N,N-dimethylformamidase beta subunit-like C-terminal domain-containing protein n=1 Tax=Falsigemmobacter faecalis TaxID=2488730 RepID=A0A3P3DPP7_9RHOB|nr:N,N-dimethylformamidase beta subunit family domain-containing protein [Falsigemmobacter faecalis]RRH76131.1 hypothetical protein EG244_06845 [Falsigemmobacter faecalis]